MTTQPTPGPWYSIPGKPWIVECQNGQGYNLSIADCSVSFNLDPEEQKANARLLAASPELLSALEGCLQLFAELGTPAGFATIQNARAAIQRAKGGE